MMPYTVIRSARRTLCLEITADLTVLVRAPRWCSQREIRRFVEEREDWLNKHMAIAQQRQRAAAARRVTPEEEAELRRRAAAYIPERVAVYSRRMGLVPTGVKITGAQKRFGSCSGKNSLCFSWRLMQYPPEAIDYVVVHELAHIRHHDHSRRFWDLVAQTMPDYPTRQALLRD